MCVYNAVLIHSAWCIKKYYILYFLVTSKKTRLTRTCTCRPNCAGSTAWGKYLDSGRGFHEHLEKGERERLLDQACESLKISQAPQVSISRSKSYRENAPFSQSDEGQSPEHTAQELMELSTLKFEEGRCQRGGVRRRQSVSQG